MKKGIIVDNKHKNFTHIRKSDFSIKFSDSEFGPYNYIFDRERLYFDEFLGERWSYDFPIKDPCSNNTEIFIERNDIVIALWTRWSFSGKTRIFVEIVNLSNANKFRFYPDSVSLIYNARRSIVIYYKKSEAYKRLELDISTLEKISETTHHLSAFFKLYYDSTNMTYGRLIYKANSSSHRAWYFIEENISSNLWKPKKFYRDNFNLTCEWHWETSIDVWEASLTWKL